MSTLNNHTLLYDDECMLCNIYTSGFISAKMLDKNGRKPFHKVSKKEEEYVNVSRAANEIALVNNENKSVTYGIDSLLKVIGYTYPWMAKIGNLNIINYLLKKLYSFISYNRKVIVPSTKDNTEALTCVPDFNLKYRILYILFAVSITSSALFYFSILIKALPAANFSREFALAVGQIAFQAIFLIGRSKEEITNYSGHIMTVSVFGSLGLFQILILNSIIDFPQTLLLFSFSGIMAFMFLEHRRRVALLGLPKYLTYTWVLYRILALVIILNI